MKWSLVPTKKITFRTQLPQQEVMRRIRAKLDAPENVNSLHRFGAEVGESSFKIWEMVRPRSNSFTPTVEGEVLEDETGTFIRIVMRMNGCVWIFVLVWCYPFALVLFLSVITSIREGLGPIDKDVILSIAFIIGMPAAMITMTALGFRSGIRTARAFLMETIGGMMNDE